jgi:hypothetical protein
VLFSIKLWAFESRQLLASFNRVVGESLCSLARLSPTSIYDTLRPTQDSRMEHSTGNAYSRFQKGWQFPRFFVQLGKFRLGQILSALYSTTTMPFRKISRNVKLAAIQLHQRDLLGLPDILECCEFSERTWFRILKLWRETGDVVNHQPSRTSCGCLHALDREDIDCLLRLVKQNPDYFLDELMHLLKTNRFISVHFISILRALERACLSYKKLK